MTQIIDLGKLRFHFAGDWNVATAYEANDVVKYGGNVYCYTYGLKTTSNPPTDTQYWALMVEGFKFEGIFDTSTQYRVGDGVTHGGKVYVAILDSTNQTPPNATYWSQFVDGIQYEGDYDVATSYQKNDLVVYGASIYIAILDTTGNNPTNATYWSRFVEGISPEGVYNSATNYVPGDLAAYGANIYRAIANTTDNIPTNATYWELFVSSTKFRGDYDNAETYYVNDIVSYGSNAYRSKVEQAAVLPTNAASWEQVVTGFSYKGVWSSATNYLVGESVTYGGSLFQAQQDNDNDNPATVAASWSKVVAGYKNRSTWTTATEYATDEVVVHGGNTYVSVEPHAAGVFETDLAASKWVKFNSGIRWRGAWAVESVYLKDDIIRDAVGTVYIATQDHTSSSDFGADKDTDAKWLLFAAGGADVLPAIGAGDAVKQLSINADGLSLEWINSMQSNSVYYVAPHGVDAPNYGTSIAYPFATIKYACAQAGTNSTIYVKNGTYSEVLPIVVPANTAIVGDSQRTTIVQPALGLSDDAVNDNNESDMWLLSDGVMLNKMTFKGMTGWVAGLTPDDITTSTVKGVVVRLNPASPIATKSPYVLECSAIGDGLVGALVDGSVHATGNKSMLFHGYTVISDNGVGFWMKDGGKSEIVSCFTYFNYFGYACSGGGFIRALNGNNSYGTWGAVSRGFDANETAIVGAIKGQILNFSYESGAILAGDTVTDSVSGATAVVTNVQYAADKVYVHSVSGTFAQGNGLTFTSGGTGTVAAGAVADQSGYLLVIDQLTALPIPGQSLQIEGDSISYVVQSVSGSFVDLTSEVSVLLAQEKVSASPDNAYVHLRNKYSQIRLTGHDFLNVGTGGITTTNYPGEPLQPAAQGNETNENFPGRVYYVSTDQDGNFRVGEYFRIDQATGRATLNASAFDLAGLTSLRLGSIGAQLGETINEFSSDATMLGNSNTAIPTEYAVKTYTDTGVASANTYTDTEVATAVSTAAAYTDTEVASASTASESYTDTAVATKQDTLVSGTTIKTVNGDSLLGSGDLEIAAGSASLITPSLNSGRIGLSSYFPAINWNSTNTQTYGWLVRRSVGVASGVMQFALFQGGARDISQGGCQSTCLPFQVNADSSITIGTPIALWTNGSGGQDFSTCSLITDQQSGPVHYSGNIPWPGNASNTMGYATAVLNADNTATHVYHSGTDNTQGIHAHNGLFFALTDSDGVGWRGVHSGYASSDSRTRQHYIDASAGNTSISVSVINPSADTSTSPVCNIFRRAGSNSSNAAILGTAHYRDGNSHAVARVWSSTSSTYQDYNSSLGYNAVYSSGIFAGFELSTGKTLVYHGAQTWLYTAYNNRTQVTAGPAPSPVTTNIGFATGVPDGTDSWIFLKPNANFLKLEKWTINPNTYEWTKVGDGPLYDVGNTTSYLSVHELPNDRLFIGFRASQGVFNFWVVDRPVITAP